MWGVGGFAAGGTLAAHWLTYRLLVPDPHHRAEVLARSGHAHLPVLSAVALAVLAAASVRLCVQALRARPHELEHAPGVRQAVARLAAYQCVGWVGVELAERLALGEPLDWAGAAPLLLVGLGVQVAVAVVAAVVLTAGARALAAVVRRRRGAPARRPSGTFPKWRAPFARRLPLCGAEGLRGPPAMVAH